MQESPRNLNTIEMFTQTYNLLPVTQRRFINGKFYAVVNGEWHEVEFYPVIPEYKRSGGKPVGWPGKHPYKRKARY